MRKRVSTLYSAETENGRDNEAAEETVPSETKDDDDRSQIEVIREVAEDMFMSMCNGFDEEIITEDNIEDAVQNLTSACINPTYSLVQTHAYALSSEEIRSSIKKLLQDVQKRSSNGEVRKCPSGTRT